MLKLLSMFGVLFFVLMFSTQGCYEAPTPPPVAGGAIISANVDFRICIYLKCKIVNYHSCARIFVEKGLCDIILILANMSQHVLLDKLSENSLFVYV